ncbi:hypothetical protein GCM10010431_63440 [Streptomyces kunmingensis]
MALGPQVVRHGDGVDPAGHHRNDLRHSSSSLRKFTKKVANRSVSVGAEINAAARGVAGDMSGGTGAQGPRVVLSCSVARRTDNAGRPSGHCSRVCASPRLSGLARQHVCT